MFFQQSKILHSHSPELPLTENRERKKCCNVLWVMFSKSSELSYWVTNPTFPFVFFFLWKLKVFCFVLFYFFNVYIILVSKLFIISWLIMLLRALKYYTFSFSVLWVHMKHKLHLRGRKLWSFSYLTSLYTWTSADFFICQDKASCPGVKSCKLLSKLLYKCCLPQSFSSKYI